ncbi:MAG: hypothetical protein L6Q49_13055 [Anaerolineales bacterium]|nr:hypothetical protein [Anaerolineales bacterium]
MLLIRVLSEGGGGPNTELLWILGILLGSFAVTIIAGWVSGSGNPRQEQAESEAHSVESVAVEDQVKTAKTSRPSKTRSEKK